MPPSSPVSGLFNVKAFAIFFYLFLLRTTCGKLVASSQRLVAVGQTFHAVCHFGRADVNRFLYWTLHYYRDHEFHGNFGGIDLSTCSPFSFDASNTILAVNTSLIGLTGHIGCNPYTGPMMLYIHNVLPEYNGLRFSCTSGRKGRSARSNKVTLVVRKPRLVTLEIEDTGGKNHTVDGGAVLRATCRVDRSLNPKFLFWATREIDDAKTKSIFGGMILNPCFRYKLRGLFQSKVDFTCSGPPEFLSTLTIRGLPVGKAIFCYVVIDSSKGEDSRIESNWLSISGGSRFIKILLSARNPSVPISGTFYAKCRFLSNGKLNECQDRIRWRGVSKFGKRAHISCNKDQNEGVLRIEPIYAADNKSQIFCYVLGEETTQNKGLTIKVTRKVPISLEILRNESTINTVPINGTFRAVCSFQKIDARTVVWVTTLDNVEVGRVSINRNSCQTLNLIKDPATANRVNILCDLETRTTALSIQPVMGLDAETEVYCASTDQYGSFVRSDSLTLKTQSANVSKIVKIRPAYKNATLLASCPFGNRTEHVIFIHPVGKYRNGSEDIVTGSEDIRTGSKDIKTGSFILLDKNCSVIDNALYLSRRFFIGCDPESETINLIVDPVYRNSSDNFRVTCVRYVLSPSSNGSSGSLRKMLLFQFPQVVYPVSKPALNYSGDMIVVNGSDPGNWKHVWLIPVVVDQEMEFTCSAGPSKSSSFNLSLYIQTSKGYVFQLDGTEKKPNDTSPTFIFKSKFRIKESYRGVFCAAENPVSRWESDFARIMFRNSSVFMPIHNWMASDNSFFRHHKTATLKMCYKICEIYSQCQGVSYHHKLCSLSNRGIQDSQLKPSINYTFHQRFQPEDILQRNDFRPDIYIKHENQTIYLYGMLDSRKGLTVTECHKVCTELLRCRSILYHKGPKMCHLSRLESVEEKEDNVIDINPYDWDAYTKNLNPGSFVVVRGVLPDANYHKPEATLPLPRSGNYQHKMMQCADSCRDKDNCVSFVATVEEDNNSIVCLLYNININEAQLIRHGRTKSKSTFYVRVRSFNSQLVLVRRYMKPPIS